MAANQFVRRDGRETLKLVVSDDIMSSSKGSSRVVLNTLANLAFPLKRVVRGLKVIISREGVGEDEVPKSNRGARVSSFPSSSLHLFDPAVM